MKRVNLIAVVLFVAASLVAHADEFLGPFPSWKDVKRDFGAVGDGKTDDAAALQKALNQVREAVLYLPAGTYRITRGLTMTSHINVSVVGEHPDKTILKWDGPEGGTMLHCNGVRFSRFGRITWDGSGKALTAVEHKWDTKTPGACTGMEHADEIFRDVGFGLRGGRAGMPHSMDAETAVLRCRFLRCSRAGLSIESFNALDWWVWDSYFEDCAVGATNGAEGEYGGGHFHLYRCLFRRSTRTDIEIGHTSYFGFRLNTSVGSKAFFIAKRPAFAQGTWKDNETWGACMMLQGNRVMDPQEPTPIRIANNGPTFLLDNRVENAGQPDQPVVRHAAPGGPSDLISIGNTYASASPLEVEGRVFTLDDASEPELQVQPLMTEPCAAPVGVARKVLEVPAGSDAAAIQAVIAEAAKLAGRRPVVHLPQGGYQIGRTIVIPAGADIQLVGDGFGTVLNWAGPGGGAVLRLEGPCRARLKEFEVRAGPPAWGPKPDERRGVCVEVTNCDQAGGRILGEQVLSGNCVSHAMWLDRLANVDVSLHDNHLNDAVAALRIVGTGRKGAGRVAIFGGVTTCSDVVYDLANGAKLVVWDSWYEGGQDRFLHLKDSGRLTLSGHTSAAGRPGANTAQTNPDFAGIELDNFRGELAILSMVFGTKMVVHGDGAQTEVLVAGSQAQETGDWVNRAPNAKALLLANRCSAPDVPGTLPEPNQGEPDPDFVRKLLTPLRTTLPKAEDPIEPGKTDLRIHRVSVRYGNIGWHIRAGE